MLFHPASPAAPHHNTTPTNHHRCNSSPATTTLPPTRTTVLPCRRPTAPPPRPLQLEPQPLTISFCYHLVADHIQFRLRWYRFSVWDWMTISGMFSLLRSCYHHDLFVVVHSPSVHLGSDLQSGYWRPICWLVPCLQNPDHLQLIGFWSSVCSFSWVAVHLPFVRVSVVSFE